MPNINFYLLTDKNKVLYWIVVFLIAILFSNCGVKKKLQEDEYFITKNDIVFADKKLKEEKKSTLEYQLLTLARPKPNAKFLIFFRAGVWAHHKTNAPSDTTSLDRFMRKRLAEAPRLYSDSLALTSANAMTNFLNKKGYYQAKVTPQEAIYPKRKVAQIDYHVELGERYYVDTIQYFSDDTLLQPIIDELALSTLFKKNEPVSENLYYTEIKRITDTLRNNGYAYFYGNYIDGLEADSTNGRKNLGLDLFIRAPENDTHHRVYRIGEVEIYPNYQAQVFETVHRDTSIGGVTFKLPLGEDFQLDPQVLVKQIFLRKGQLFRQKDFDKTNELIGNLGLFKFIDLDLEKDPNEEGLLNLKIYLTQSKQRSVGFEAELNNSLRSIVTNTNRLFSLGAGVNVNYQNRNTFGGGELFNLILESGVEVNFLDDRAVRVNFLDLTARTDLFFPKFIDYLGYWKLFNRVRFGEKKSLLTDNFYQDLREKARSRVSLGYSYESTINNYTTNTFNISLGYNLNRTPNERIVFDQTGLDFFQSEATDSFLLLLPSEATRRSFEEDILFTGFLYRDINYTWTSNVRELGGIWQFRVAHELSGAEVLLLNTLVNNQRKAFKINNIGFSHHTRLELDIRYNRAFLNESAFAFRMYSGIATPFGGLTQTVPYIKQFFVGGPNSMRAWLIRELGPGSFFDPAVTEPPFYQAADFKTEFNAEYRFDLAEYFLLEGALFLDAGNIWTLRNDPERPGSQLSSDFINQLAVGGGVGFRFDFSFFIIRLDMGYKLRTPYLDENNRQWQLYRFSDYNFIDFFRPRNVNYNLGIGYPF